MSALGRLQVLRRLAGASGRYGIEAGGRSRIGAMGAFGGVNHRFLSTAEGDADDDVGETAQRVLEIAENVSQLSLYTGDEPFRWWHPVRWVTRTSHDYLGMEWWAAITFTTMVVRVLISPGNIAAFTFSEKMRRIQPQVTEMKERAMDYAKKGNMEMAKEEQMKLQKMMTSQGGMFRGIIGPFLQMPVFFAMYKSIRDMAENNEGFKTGGFLWVEDLSAMDSTHSGPILSSVVTWAMFEAQRHLSPQSQEGRMQGVMKVIGRLFPVLALFFTWNFPSGIFFYWIPNAIFGVGLNYILQLKPVSRFLLRDKRKGGLVVMEPAAEKVQHPAPTAGAYGDLEAALTYMPPKKRDIELIKLTSRRMARGGK